MQFDQRFNQIDRFIHIPLPRVLHLLQEFESEIVVKIQKFLQNRPFNEIFGEVANETILNY